MAAERDPLAAIPAPSARRLALRVTAPARRALLAGHPWLFDGAIVEVRGGSDDGARPGDLAVVFDEKGRFVAVGLWDPASPIRVRVLAHGESRAVDRAWLAGRVAAAAAVRAPLAAQGTDGYRLIHGENDGLGGLVVDRYADTLVVKLYTEAWLPWLADLRAALAESAPSHARLVLRLSRDLLRRPDALHGLSDGETLAGSPPDGPVTFTENALRFEADVLHGQKTGFFLDQRDNRSRVGDLAAGRRVLDAFACTGAFSLYAARGRATEVLSLDAAAPALESARRSFALNAGVPAVAAARHTVLAADAFAALADFGRRGRRWDLVVVDPPAFAHREDEVPRALEAYGRLTALALRVLAPGGVLVQCSCSSRVAAGDFFAAVNRAAERAGRPLSEIARTGHALDHPIAFPEGAYLKALFATAP